MPEQRNNQGRPMRPPQQNRNYPPVQAQGQFQRPTQQRSVQAPIRQVSRQSQSGYRGMKAPKRRRRPTPFLIILIVFLIVLMIVVFTSKSFKNWIAGIGEDTADAVESNTSDSKKDSNDLKPIPADTNQETQEESTVPPPEDDEFLICIDPGHGFGDVGASSDLIGSLTEKDINLFVAKEVYKCLKDAGYNVMLSHDGETLPISPIDDGDNLFYIDERVSYVNSKKVDLFISLHCDSFGTDSSVYGTRIYYCNNYKFTSQAADLAETVKRSINETFPKYKESRTFAKDISEAYYVTYETNAPAILIELGFISNENDAKCLLDEEWRSNMGYAIANAVSVYLYESNTEE